MYGDRGLSNLRREWLSGGLSQSRTRGAPSRHAPAQPRFEVSRLERVASSGRGLDLERLKESGSPYETRSRVVPARRAAAKPRIKVSRLEKSRQLGQPPLWNFPYGLTTKGAPETYRTERLDELYLVSFGSA